MIGTIQVDSVTGFTGQVTAHVTYGSDICDRVELTPTQLGEDGKFVESRWIDVPRLVGYAPRSARAA